MGEQLREIKFRAWNGKEMFNVDVLAISPCTWDCPDYGKRGASIAYQPHIKVMQYTCLKDKNGVEIYEGDIVQFTVNKFGSDGLEKTVNKGVVYYNDDMTLSVDGWMLSRIKSREVIGNIYENPDLLKAPDKNCNPPCDSSLRDGINEPYCCKEVKE